MNSGRAVARGAAWAEWLAPEPAWASAAEWAEPAQAVRQPVPFVAVLQPVFAQEPEGQVQAAGEQADKSNNAASSNKQGRFIFVLLRVVSALVYADLESSLCEAPFRVRQIPAAPRRTRRTG